MLTVQYRRPGTLWYVSDGLIWDDLPVSYRTDPTRPLECSSKLFVYNPQRRAARVEVRCYHTQAPPASFALRVAPGRIETVELAARPEVPHRQSFWIAVEADTPVLAQARHEDYTFWDPVPDALVAVAPYPGPLEGETRWVFPDCYESDPRQGWYEYETLSILNPGKQAVAVKVRYLLRNTDLGGEEEIGIPGERVAQLDVWQRAPRLLGHPQGPPVHLVGDYAVRLDASGPVVAQTTRRARWVGRPSIVGARSTMGIPLMGRLPRCWLYPGGAIVDRGILPRARPGEHPLNQCDNTWNLLFINNLDEQQPAQARVTFHQADGTASTSGPIAVPPLKSTLHCLHGEPWLGEYTHVGRPFALTVQADRPVAPEVTCAEFEMWSQVCPGAMSAVNFYPGPLSEERTWWLGIGQAGGRDDSSVEWQQSYHVFNPGAEPVEVTLSFLGLTRRAALRHTVSVPPGGVTVVNSRDIKGLPFQQPFAVRAEADRPFCAQAFGRTFTRGLPATRAMYSHMGLPMTLER